MVNAILPATAAATLAAQSWDYIVVGGGTAGLALATRLSETPNVTVAVLEAGPDRTTDPNILIAGNWVTTYQNPEYDWGFVSTPQKNAAGQSVAQPRGKLLGGSSGINAMEWTMGSQAEYDAFAVLGNPGWDYKSLLPYFKKAENYHAQKGNPWFPDDGTLQSDEAQGGPVQVSWNTYYTSLTTPFLNALETLGLKVSSNPDSGRNIGVFDTARSVDSTNGHRSYSAVTYLPQAEQRTNFKVLTGAQATKINFKRSNNTLTATGVEFIANSQTTTITANKEVILSAGSLMTPQILELSGIGQKSVLNKYGIPTLVDLPVGENLQDHLMLSLEYAMAQDVQSNLTLISVPSDFVPTAGETDAVTTMTGTPFAWSPLKGAASAEGYADLMSTLDGYLNSSDLTPLERAQFLIQKAWLKTAVTPEVEIMFAAYPGTPGLPLPDGTYGAWIPSAHLHPLSRGSVHIASTNPLQLPIYDPNYLGRDFDLKALFQIVNFTQTLVKSGTMASYVTESVAPPNNVTSEADLTEWIKSNIATVFHPVGTAAMAPKVLGGVVSPELVVYGTTNLRVADASIIPIQIGATTQHTCYAIAEKAADLIKKSHN